MATQVQSWVGVDVSKAELVSCRDPEQPVELTPNEATAIEAWLKTLPKGTCLAVEATNIYHLELVQRAYRRGFTVYLIDGLRLERYRQSLGHRAKTDSHDAQLLRRYLEREHADLRVWNPPPKAYVELQQLLRRRATLVRATVALKQSLVGLDGLKRETAALLRQLQRLDQRLQRRLREAVQHHGWADDVARCEAIEGVGPLTATAVTMAFHRGHFRHSDAFIAFLGLDVRVRDSGTYRGRRKLTKQGDPELRRLLFLAAMQACRSATWKPFYQRYLDRGLSKIQALVILARKLARVAFALLRQQAAYTPRLDGGTCPET